MMVQQTITKEMTIAAALKLKPAAADVLMAKGMHCLGCSIASGETLEQAAEVHGLELSLLIKDLNAA